jgi:2'-5' RNA ligase
MGESRSSIRWVQPEQMHLTLVFLGETPEDVAAAVVDAMSVPMSAPTFDMVFQGVGVFPPHGAPRALWIGVGDGSSEVIDVQREIANRVAACGVALETRPFRPHLTLGRWRHSRPSDRRQALARSTSHAVARARVSAATLYQSRISSAGSTYTALARATLSEC